MRSLPSTLRRRHPQRSRRHGVETDHDDALAERLGEGTRGSTTGSKKLARAVDGGPMRIAAWSGL
jgi:hypothetical protein